MKRFQEFLKEFEKAYIPLFKECAQNYWVASLTGKSEDWDKSETSSKKQNALFSNKAHFAVLKELKEEGKIADPVAKRQLDLLYLWFLGCQVDTAKLDAVTTLATQIEKKFNNFRAIYKGKTMTDNDVLATLKTSTDSAELEGVWLEQKRIGKLVMEDMKKLVHMRNENAKCLGFKNYHQMSLVLAEQDPENILDIFDKLDALTKKSFEMKKKELDTYLAGLYKIKEEELMPWHYHNQFFQEGPMMYKIDYDSLFKGKDISKITESYYSGLGFEIADILKHSDLYQKEGKSQHAYCLDMNREGDVRVLSNNIDNHLWMGTMLHECGHAIYEKSIDSKLPFILREEAHICTTEAIAMLFERLASNASWLHWAVGLTPEQMKAISETSSKQYVLDQLVFSRWSQVMYRFEKTLYENPEQNLDDVWWQLVEKYQLIKKPIGRHEPDWACKNHTVTSPCYYHNYLLGNLFTSQLNYYICSKIVPSDKILEMEYAINPEVGKYLREKVFAPGKFYHWKELIERSTGEELNPKYYALEIEECLKH